jgi:hypothetical protein
MENVRTWLETLHMSNCKLQSVEALQRTRQEKERRLADEAAPNEDVVEFERAFAEQIRDIQGSLEALERGSEVSMICEGLKQKLLECSRKPELPGSFPASLRDQTSPDFNSNDSRLDR